MSKWSPRTPPPGDPPSQTTRAAGPGPATISRMKAVVPPKKRGVLVADDDDGTRAVVADCLSREGYHVVTAVDGQEALDKLAQGNIDVVMLDARMPRMGGFDACRLIKAMPNFLPVLIVAAKTDAGSRAEGLRLGADDYLAKPFQERELIARIADLVRIKGLHEEMQEARAKLERLSSQDELTGVYNYRYIHTRLNEEFKRAERDYVPLACCLVAVDRLNVENERSGRAAGDAVLRKTADGISSALREDDLVARYGGDEFLVLLPATHFAGALVVAQRIWANVRKVTCDAGPTVVSLAVALYPTRDVRNKESLLRAAEAALTEAKREGGNRLCVYQQEGLIYSPEKAET